MRAATSPELTKLRSDGQWSRLYLAFAEQTVIFQARVNGTFSTTDQVASVPFDTVTTGAYTDLAENQTLYIGSSAGASDLGMARIKSATSTSIKIARTSDVSWADNLYLTAVREYGLWAKQPLMDPAGPRLDDDLSYTDQLSKMRPIPILGPDALLRLASGTVSYHPSASTSWVPGSTISAYAWTVTPSTGVTVANGSTATPTITLTLPGTYDLKLVVSAANGRNTTGHRTLRVVGGAETPITEFTLDQLQADMQAGGWSATITLLAQADQTAVRDRGKVFVYADDYYAGALGSVGQISELEHQVFVGWIVGESIEYNASYGTLTFDVKGPGHWLTTIGSTATYIEQVTSNPANWNQMTRTTLAEIVWYFAVWRSTAAQTIDIIKPTLTTEFGGITAGMGSIWSQMTDAATNRLLCEPRCDRYGRLCFDRDPQIMTGAEKNALPVVMGFTQADCQDKIELERKITPDTGVLELSGLYFGGNKQNLILSRASGWTLKRFGKPETRDRIVATDQADANRIAGSLLGKANNPYPRVTLRLAENNRMIDIAPASYCTLSIASGDTPRGVVWSTQRIIPRKITQTWDPVSGAPSTTVEFEPESSQDLAVTVDVPTIGKINVPTQPTPPTIPYNPYRNPYWPQLPPGIIQEPPPTDEVDCLISAPANGPYPVFLRYVLYDNKRESAYVAFSGTRLVVRGTGASAPTTLVINCIFEEFDGTLWNENASATWAEAYVLDTRGTRVATGVWSGTGRLRTIVFSPAANTRISAFEIVLVDYQELTYESYTDELILDYGGEISSVIESNNLIVTELEENTGIDVYREVKVVFQGKYVYADQGGMDLSYFQTGSAFFDPDPPVWVQHTLDMASFTINSQGPGSDHIGIVFDYGSTPPADVYIMGLRARKTAGFGGETLVWERSDDGISWAGGSVQSSALNTWTSFYYNWGAHRYVRVRASTINQTIEVAYLYYYDNTGGTIHPASIVTKTSLFMATNTQLATTNYVWSNTLGDTPKSWGLGVYSNAGADFTDSEETVQTGLTVGTIYGYSGWGASMTLGDPSTPITRQYDATLNFSGSGAILCEGMIESSISGEQTELWYIEHYIIRQRPGKRLILNSAVVYNICA